MLKNIKKINFIEHDYLISGNNGWRFISNNLKKISHPEGIPCFEWLDEVVREKKIPDKAWMGFLHNTISYPTEYPNKYKDKIYPLEELIKNNYFLESLRNCQGIFVFTKEIRSYLLNKLNFNKIFFVYHPSAKYQISWSGSCERILHIGQQLRRYHSFLDLNTKKEKRLIVPKNCEEDLVEMKNYSKNNNVIYTKQMIIDDYLSLLSSSIVFLDLYDVAACNTIIECTMMNTPILLRKLNGCIEYLGFDYPFYFDTIEEANLKIDDQDLIIKSNLYLKKMNKNFLDINVFLKRVLKYNS